jgi:prepilin-type N-terminal cleavage/methylation domain-containing protein
LANGKNERGFTLIEVIVAIAVVAILAGVITPSVIKHLNDSKRARAQNDCLVIGSTIASFFKDTGRMPTMNAAGAVGITLLVSDGSIPAVAAGVNTWNNNLTTAAADLFSNHLAANTPKSQNANLYPTPATAPGSQFVWRGPYQPEFPPDPWGNRYAVNIGNMNGNAVWVLSAGEDGIIQTAFVPAAPAVGSVLTASGDDIVYRLR